MSDNPNYRPNALSRFYEDLAARCGKAWAAFGWLPLNYVKALSIGFLLLSPIWIWLIYKILGEIFSLTGDTTPRTTSEDLRNVAYALGITITALAGLVAAPLILVRAWVHERQTTAAEQGLITDRFTRAVEQLGTEKTVKHRERVIKYRLPDDRKGARLHQATEIEGQSFALPEGAAVRQTGAWESVEETLPNLEVRLGAIYALERIAQDSERDHIPIMETLCAYVRENSPGGAAKDHDLGDWEPLPDDASEEDRAAHLKRRQERFGRFHARSKAWTWAQTLAAPRADIQAALTVIGRRPEERISHERRQRAGGTGGETGFRLDLRGANLQRADLTGLDLARALLTGTRLEGAFLGEARLEGAFLGWARLEGADLGGANLKSADLRDWTCARTSLRSADFTEAENLTQDHVNAAYGDSGTILPEGLVMPDHWDDETIELYEDDPKYQAWLAAGAPPGKPRRETEE